jgi:hypothetical protein
MPTTFSMYASDATEKAISESEEFRLIGLDNYTQNF